MNEKKLRCIAAIIAVLIVTAAPAISQVATPSGLVAWYTGDGNFSDSSGNGLNATPAAGSLAPTFVVGKVGQGFNTNGALQRATIPDSPAFRPQSFTIEGWVRIADTSNNTKVFFSKTIGTSFFNSYAFYSSGSTLRGSVCTVSNCVEVIAPTTANVWRHVAFTFDDPGGASTKTATIYIDGAVAASSTTSIAPQYDTHPVVLGADIDNEVFAAGWIGGFDEISFYNRALLLTEIQSISGAGINGKTKQSATNAGANSQTAIGDATLTFDNVATGGTTSSFTIPTATAGTLPAEHIPTALAYDISTTAVFSGNVQTCFFLPAFSADKMNSLRVFHREGTALVDRTSSTNAAARTICASTTSLSRFVIAAVGVRTGQIVYNRFQPNANEDGTIWAINPNGTGDHFLTNGSNPRVSPNGAFLAFKRKRGVTTDVNFNYSLWLLDMTTGEEKEIFYSGDFLVGFDFSPDSFFVIFDWSCAIYRIPTTGTSAATFIIGTCFDDQPTANPVTGMIAFHSQNGLVTTNASGGNRLAVPNTVANDLIPSWSKDGQFLAYIHYDGVSSSPYVADTLYKIKPDGTGKVLLKSLTGADRFGQTGVWSPNGSVIYMPARIGGVSGIYAVATDGSGTISLAPFSSELIAAGSNAEFVGFVNGLVPTAATVSIGGRVISESAGVSRARVTLTDSTGVSRTVTTGSFGNFRFEDLEAGRLYVVSVASKRFKFAPQLVTPVEGVTEILFDAGF